MRADGGPESMEESIIILPVLANGVIALGDLWDCRNNVCPGSILDPNLSGETLRPDSSEQASPPILYSNKISADSDCREAC